MHMWGEDVLCLRQLQLHLNFRNHAWKSISMFNIITVVHYIRSCVPLVVEAFGGWGIEVQQTFQRSLLASIMHSTVSLVWLDPSTVSLVWLDPSTVSLVWLDPITVSVVWLDFYPTTVPCVLGLLPKHSEPCVLDRQVNSI